VPAGSRGALKNMGFLLEGLTDSAKNQAVGKLEALAASLGCSMAQLAIAWVAKNPRVSTVITGASKLSQLQENLGAIEVLPRLTPEIMAGIDEISAPLAN
jgi:aryl-alcohol dehydrogenase-like predicted oxidoreductase